MSDQMIDVEQFRREARTWLAENLERWPDPELIPSGGEDPAPEAVAEGRVIQRRLFDAGYAGITYPTEYGGAGLTPAHERPMAVNMTRPAPPNCGITNGSLSSLNARSWTGVNPAPPYSVG